MPTGGHLGFRGEGHYRHLLRAQFNARNEGPSSLDEETGPDSDLDNSAALASAVDADGDMD
jgi:hypothetical protein